MKTLPLLLTLLVAAATAVAQAPATPAPAVADQAFSEMKTIAGAQERMMRDPRWRTTAAPERARIGAAGAELLCAFGERVLADFPSDPRRWDVVLALFTAQRAFDGADAEARQAAWDKRCGEFRTMVMTATDVPEPVVGTVLYVDTIRAVRPRGQEPDMERAAKNAEFLAAHLPAVKNRGMVESVYLEALRRIDGAAADRRLQQLATDSNPLVSDMARLKLGALALTGGPVELKFPDLDGREIDLAKYRGKVVLLDFWATWCVPCMAEMPNLKAVYAKYHEKGFEIIGITDDIPARDPQNPRAGEKTLATLKAALAKEEMPWPQLWDTRVQDPPTVKRLLRQFDVGSLPTALLLDKDGRIYSKDNHGELLEANVKKLLGL